MTSDIRNMQRGFSLIEAMVSLVVISVGMIGIASLYGQGLGASRTALQRTVAVNLAADLADRIRANRLGEIAYEGPAADHDCDPETGGGTIDCTPADMATNDLFVWTRQVAAQLPAGQGVVDFTAGTPPTYAISVSWTEAGLGTVTYRLAAQIPNL